MWPEYNDPGLGRWCVDVYVCVCVAVYVCRPEVNIWSLPHFCTLYFRQGYSQNLKHSILARLAVKRAPGILLSPPSHTHTHTHTPRTCTRIRILMHMHMHTHAYAYMHTPSRASPAIATEWHSPLKDGAHNHQDQSHWQGSENVVRVGEHQAITVLQLCPCDIGW